MRNTRAVQGSSGDAPEHEAVPENNTAKFTDSLLVNDEKWIDFVQEKTANKHEKYQKMKNIGICLILLLVTGQSIVSE